MYKTTHIVVYVILLYITLYNITPSYYISIRCTARGSSSGGALHLIKQLLVTRNSIDNDNSNDYINHNTYNHNTSNNQAYIHTY